ncbi:MAG: hypothetical protein K0Q67_1522 [Cellvibrio sp.]|jgi:hypothetical protein|nr:hypothetical protein [Cellvibrio sp.]
MFVAGKRWLDHQFLTCFLIVLPCKGMIGEVLLQ